MLISIVIPNYNGEKFIDLCLDSIQESTYKNYELILVDNGSIDHSIDLIKNRKEDINLIENNENLGFAKAVNQGILEAKGDYVVLLNNDIEVDKKWLYNLYHDIRKNNNIFAISSKMVQFNNRQVIDSAGDEYTLLGWAYKSGDFLDVNQFTKPREVFSACAGAAIYDKKKLLEIGLFDEEFFAYLEDIDLSYRARIHGYKIYYSPTSIVYHVGSGTTGSRYNEFKVKYSARNNLYVVYKNMPLVQLLINLPFIVLGDCIKWIFTSKQGYSKTYINNKIYALGNLKNMKKTPFTKVFNYIKIEWLLIKNLFTYINYRRKRLMVRLTTNRK